MVYETVLGANSHGQGRTAWSVAGQRLRCWATLKSTIQRGESYRARNWPCPMVRDNQQSGKDELSFNELVILDECPCLTIIRKLYFWEGLVDFLAKCPTDKWKFSPISSPVLFLKILTFFSVPN